jgi:hypothetical protein
MNGLQASGPILPTTHHGAVKRASRNTPPVNPTTRSTSESASMSDEFTLPGVPVKRPGVPAIQRGRAVAYFLAHRMDENK